MQVQASQTSAQAPQKTDDNTPKATVQDGQSLDDIAKANHTTVDELLRLNPQLKADEPLKTGQEISLPQPDAVDGAASTDAAKPAPQLDQSQSDYQPSADAPAPQTARPALEPAPDV